MDDILKFFNNLMNEWHIPYTFDGWDDDLELPHWIGEIREVPTLDEDGKSEYSFTLTGFDATLSKLFLVSEKLKKNFKNSKIISGMVITYENTIPIKTDGEGIKNIEVILNIKKWSE